ncbi:MULTISPECIES: ABC transporter permease [unclassified Amycolatopsis]|uniref:ABC transporter permease n=1 Tax=unclassified Amycolatopsis TaxID=2618356 RepID=UPI0028755D91|nr:MULTISPECIES: ABC transporter permease [unclassified Amycolatopsis]MDS0135837.1 ABC transporter permease [Amycolatopsis sp. 505]MDS0145562.1 ABC transporter permease [Amycolatopsis sp. CM201R]
MPRYLLGRFAQAVFVVWAAFTVTFVAIRLLPGDPVALMLNGRGGGEAASPQDIARVSAELGFDGPIAEQYLRALAGALHGDFGQSIQTGLPVSGMISVALPRTLQLGAAALALSLVAGTALAVAANLVRSPLGRQALRSVPSVAVAMPSFWVGLMLIQLFSLKLKLFPSLGGDGLAGLVLPACTLAIPGAALVGQVLSKSLHATLREPYADTIRATGASELRVLLGHGLRNAAIPAITIVGLLAGYVIGGSVVVESVFSRPGMGQDIFFAVTTQDLPVVQGVVVVASVAFVAVNLAVDLLCPVLDPRIRSTGRQAVAR